MGFLCQFGVLMLRQKTLATTSKQLTKLKYGICMDGYTPEKYVYLIQFLKPREISLIENYFLERCNYPSDFCLGRR